MARLAELLNGLVVVTEILLAADQNDGKALAEVQDLGDPLGEHVSAAEEGTRRTTLAERRSQFGVD